MPDISIAPGYGRLLTLLVKMNQSQSILEIGALGGYSGICLARGLSEDGKLLSLELKQEFADVARRHLELAGLAEHVFYRIGDAQDSIQQLCDEGLTFDFFFIDANKAAYPFYLSKCIELSVPGAVIVADNTILKGRVADPENQSESVQAMREFNETMIHHPKLEGVVLPAYDGLSVARVRA